MRRRRDILGRDLGHPCDRFQDHIELRRQYLQFGFGELDPGQSGQVRDIFSGECHLVDLLWSSSGPPSQVTRNARAGPSWTSQRRQGFTLIGLLTHRDAVTLHPNFLRLLNVSGLEVRCPPWLSRLTQRAAPGDVANVTTNSPAATTQNGRGPVISTPRGVVALIAVTAALVGALALKQFAWLVGPILLALVIVTLTHPVHVWLQRQ